jgi:tetratricopeptide (TPR) repeat protein/tRNA A-37 threonylcarbamoyl transferase component Bud32
MPSEIFGQLPPYREAMARGDWKKAITLLEGQSCPDGSSGLSPTEAIALASLYGTTGDHRRAVSVLEGLCGHRSARVSSEAHARLAAHELRHGDGVAPKVEQLLERSTELARDNVRAQGVIAHVRSQWHRANSETDETGQWLERARELLETVGDEEELAKVLDSLATYYEHRGESNRALSCYSLSLAKKAQWRDLHGIAITLGNLGRFHLRNKDPHAALLFFRDDLRIARQMGDRRAESVIKINIGQALADLGRLDEARAEIAEALDLAHQQGWLQNEIYAIKDLARVVALQGDPGRALALLQQALELLPADTMNYPRAMVLLARGDVCVSIEDFEAAQAAFETARDIFGDQGARQEEAMALHGLATVAEHLEDWNSCLHFVEEGLNCVPTLASPMTATFTGTFEVLQAAAANRDTPHAIGPYRVLEKLGGGAFADVFRAFDDRQDASRDDVAIKVLRLDYARNDSDREERLTRFRRECEVLKRIEHANVVRYLDVGDEPDPFLVQEYVSGGDLQQLVRNGRPLPVDQAVTIVRGILAGLGTLHAQGIVHRDLKPANVLLRGDDQPVITDFGIARVVDMTALTLQSAVLGTLNFMAPEQLNGGEVGPPVDIYACGVTFFYLLTARLPYDEGSVAGILKSLQEDADPGGLSRLNGVVPDAVLECLRGSLKKSRDRRFASVAEVLEVLAKL